MSARTRAPDSTKEMEELEAQATPKTQELEGLEAQEEVEAYHPRSRQFFFLERFGQYLTKLKNGFPIVF